MSINPLQSTALFKRNFINYSMTNTSGCCYSL